MENSGPPPGEWNGWPFDFSGFPHDDYGPPLNYGIWLLTGLAAIFMGLRVFCKYLRRRELWWDDYFLMTSWACLAAQTSLITFNTTIGYGKHIWDFHPNDLPLFLLVSNTSGFFSILAAMWSKTSFALTVLRISDRWVKWVVWFIIISVNVFMGFAAMATYLQCTPMEKLWTPLMQGGTCWPKQVIINYNVFTAAYSGAMDVVLALLPWKIILSMSLNKKEKTGVLFAMSMGVFAGVISFAKITQLQAINKFDLIDGIWLSVLATAESSITIMAASVPILRALIRPVQHRPPASFYDSRESDTEELVKDETQAEKGV
ncbi:hypothetical protein B0T16DRAFT_457301 [Cercophora newfieldiana]|uniref:Rhodopsin domain-containing protein n=1 Tax=Cercophora newfieldiana TaxID=92897 RepID=A0AA40CUU6_9PEZI|nr:hypothetical protein B0T16DRAFT_457301 [Cercophora newfieldiana]